jgi:hypothetical protein
MLCKKKEVFKSWGKWEMRIKDYKFDQVHFIILKTQPAASVLTSDYLFWGWRTKSMKDLKDPTHGGTKNSLCYSTEFTKWFMDWGERQVNYCLFNLVSGLFSSFMIFAQYVSTIQASYKKANKVNCIITEFIGVFCPQILISKLWTTLANIITHSAQTKM